MPTNLDHAPLRGRTPCIEPRQLTDDLPNEMQSCSNQNQYDAEKRSASLALSMDAVQPHVRLHWMTGLWLRQPGSHRLRAPSISFSARLLRHGKTVKSKTLSRYQNPRTFIKFATSSIHIQICTEATERSTCCDLRLQRRLNYEDDAEPTDPHGGVPNRVASCK
jgi:hypothetical protein